MKWVAFPNAEVAQTITVVQTQFLAELTELVGEVEPELKAPVEKLAQTLLRQAYNASSPNVPAALRALETSFELLFQLLLKDMDPGQRARLRACLKRRRDALARLPLMSV